MGVIERGKITASSGGKYTVMSYDRDGIVTPPLSAMTEGDTFQVGDDVFYLIFRDGTGRILGVLDTVDQ